jgi:hypothetical protein
MIGFDPSPFHEIRRFNELRKFLFGDFLSISELFGWRRDG